MKKTIAFLLLTILVGSSFVPQHSFKIAVLKYSGGGDWYANPSSLPNLAKFCNLTMETSINVETEKVSVGSADIFSYPFLHMTGHGNVVFSDQDAQNLRKYLLAGGFLHIDDNYGMDKFIRPQIKKVFPEYKLVEIPFSHDLYKSPNKFPNGLPKIHEHDNKAPKGFGIVHKGRIVLYYTYECDLGDGWEDAEVHNDTKEARTQALQMGANIMSYALTLGED
ncbi:MAG: hypothetical protein ACJAZ2_001387 [Glaciecola sp.]|jgi:hypothetical protein